MAIKKSIRVMQLMQKYSRLYTNLAAGKKESKNDWAARMLVESGHDPEDVVTMDFDEFIEKHNTIKKEQ